MKTLTALVAFLETLNEGQKSVLLDVISSAVENAETAEDLPEEVLNTDGHKFLVDMMDYIGTFIAGDSERSQSPVW